MKSFTDFVFEKLILPDEKLIDRIINQIIKDKKNLRDLANIVSKTSSSFERTKKNISLIEEFEFVINKVYKNFVVEFQTEFLYDRKSICGSIGLINAYGSGPLFGIYIDPSDTIFYKNFIRDKSFENFILIFRTIMRHEFLHVQQHKRSVSKFQKKKMIAGVITQDDVDRTNSAGKKSKKYPTSLQYYGNMQEVMTQPVTDIDRLIMAGYDKDKITDIFQKPEKYIDIITKLKLTIKKYQEFKTVDPEIYKKYLRYAYDYLNILKINK